MKELDRIYEHFFNFSPDLLCIAGYDGYFKKVNQAVCDTLGYNEKELYSAPINHFVFTDDKLITRKVREQLTQHKPLLDFDNRYVHKNGEIINLSWSSLPFESKDVIFAIGRNITHKKKLEQERVALIAKLTNVNKDLKQINYTTSHDLRSPVNNLLTLLNLIDASKIEDQETTYMIEMVISSGKNLKEALDNYVDAITERTAERTQIHTVHFNTTLQNVLKSIQAILVNSKANLHVDFEEAKEVVFNKIYLESIFLNLLTNAVKYAQPGIEPKIAITSRKKAGFIILEVEDNGMGFDMEKVKDKIFGLHQNFHNNTDSKGVGLYLVHNHVTNLGGTIHLESQPNKGSKFTITFAKQP